LIEPEIHRHFLGVSHQWNTGKHIFENEPNIIHQSVRSSASPH